MANIAYIRVSTINQNEARQLDVLNKYQIDRIFSEKVSAKDMQRPQLQEIRYAFSRLFWLRIDRRRKLSVLYHPHLYNHQQPLP